MHTVEQMCDQGLEGERAKLKSVGFSGLIVHFLDVARPPSRDPPPGDRLPGGFRSDGPEIRPGVGARPGNVTAYTAICTQATRASAPHRGPP
eukprot:4226124-Pyramimonas_sp.AAC.2